MFRRVVTVALCCGLAASGADASSGTRIPSLLRMRGGVAAAPRKMSVQVVRAKTKRGGQFLTQHRLV
jgi:hypothetical protein